MTTFGLPFCNTRLEDFLYSSLSMESTNRCKPLLTCAVSILEIASKAYTRTQHSDGPIGSTTKKMVNVAITIFPFIRLKHFLLAIISFTDNRILSLEKIIQTLFPPSTKLFDKIDNYAHSAESLPAKFDAALDKLPTIIHKVPFLDWALVYIISWLKFFISKLTNFGSNTYKEKEIVVDTCGNNHRNEKSSVDKSHLSVSSNYEARNENVKGLTPELVGETNVIKPPIISDITKISYKEILEKGKKESDDENEENNVENVYSEKNSETDENNEENGNEEKGNEDPILDLFESSWHMKPQKVAKNTSISRSTSYA